MSHFHRRARVRLLVAALVVCLVAASVAHAQVSVPATGTPVTENFDTLASAGTSSTVPALTPSWLASPTLHAKKSS